MINSCDIFRIDSFYYAKDFLNDENLLSQFNTVDLHETATLRSFGAYSLNNEVEYQSEGIPFIRCVNMKSGKIDFSDLIYIDNTAHHLLWKSEISPESVLLSMSGSVGNVAIALPSWNYPMNSNQDIAKIVFNQKYNPYIAYLFFMSKFGQNFMTREARGSVQQHVYLSQIETIKMPIFGETLCNQLELVVKSAFDTDSQSTVTYTAAEQLLLTALDMQNFTPSAEPIAVKSLSESFGTSGRLDSEYYQSKYDELLNKLSKYNLRSLGGNNGIVTIKKSIEPGSNYYSDEGIPFVRVSDITKYGISAPNIKIPHNIFGNIKGLYPRENTILLSKDGSVGIAYKMERDEQFITSGALLHLEVRDKNILPDYLTLVLNSIVVQLQAERDTGGSIIQHWKPSEIEEMVIPVLDNATQTQIAELVQSSFALRRESEQLLESAKRAVEVAIEQGEDAAMAMLRIKGGSGS